MADFTLRYRETEPAVKLKYVEAKIKPEVTGHVTPTYEKQTVYPAAGTTFGRVDVDPIPDPTAVKEIDSNGDHDVRRYGMARVNVPIPPGYVRPSGSLDITENADGIDVTEKARVNVNVPIPPGYIKPTGKVTITENGTVDVSRFSEAEVRVSSTPRPVLLETVDISSFGEQVNRITIDATKYDLSGYMILYVVGEDVTLSGSDWLYLSDNGSVSRYLEGSRTIHNFLKLFYVNITDEWRGVLGNGATRTTYPYNGDTTPLNQIIFYAYSSSTKFIGGRLKIYAV